MVRELYDFSISDINKVDILRLCRSPNIGYKTFYDLIKLYKTPKNALNALPELISRNQSHGRIIKITSTEEAEREIEQVQEYHGKIITIYDKSYPKLLKYISDPPPVITIVGNELLLEKRIFAIVGSRNASANGCRIAYKLAQELSENGFQIVSGLARGIDTAAHKGSLEFGTIAVIAGGIDNIYPLENTQLYHAISKNGVIISELPFGTVPRSQNFPQRNRIIAGLAEGILVVEASFKSGSLITADFALEQNKEIFAIPGFPLDPRYHGTNNLIKQGATLVANVNDILHIMNTESIAKQDSLNDNDTTKGGNSFINTISNDELDSVRQEVMGKLNYTPIEIDELSKGIECSYQALITILLELELAGKLLRYPGNKVSLMYQEA